MNIRIRLLDSVAISDGRITHTPSHHIRRGVLAALSLNAGKLVTFEAMKHWCWVDAPASALPNLRSAVSGLRTDLEKVIPGTSGLLTTQRGARGGSGGGYRLAIDPGQVDVIEFEHLCSQAHRRFKSADWPMATRYCLQAEALWSGGFSTDLPSTPTVSTHETALVLQHESLLETLFSASLLEGAEITARLPELSIAVSQAPHRERLRLLHAAAQFLVGDLEGALASIKRCMMYFDELGVGMPESIASLQYAALNRDASRVRALIHNEVCRC
ncbi:AfsR/SARP family transcriptional regulator [Glycomyces tritici]|uniref:Bacterial transcriptional activator domain-containing protein n=1 Tax=Glycomyces tritici TaxID=2665176 RepID=A0ABT7YX08_9ACTN|nr:bacterial transcriptional activator domain-containing protein [Glycomyces tritici]MDN3243178.1 bacterial transcriptional activator domain-containing protein [Glycomyces tritici]